MGKLTISMAIFNSFLYVYQDIPWISGHFDPIWSAQVSGLRQLVSQLRLRDPQRLREAPQQAGKPWETMGFSWENHGITMGFSTSP